MAAPIKKLFEEVRYEVLKIVLLNTFIDAAILFLAAHLIFSVFSMPLAYSGVLAALFFIGQFWRKSAEFNLKNIEKNNPELKEMLRTANDNLDQESLMAEALFQEVITKMRRVSSGTFLDLNKLLKKVGVLFVLSIILVSLAFFNVSIAKFHDPFAAPLAKAGNFFKDLVGEGELPEETITLDEDGLYGKAQMADLGEDELNLQINPSINQIDFSNVEDPDALGDSIEDFPGAAEAVRDESYTEGLEDIADRKTAAQYAQQINK